MTGRSGTLVTMLNRMVYSIGSLSGRYHPLSGAGTVHVGAGVPNGVAEKKCGVERKAMNWRTLSMAQRLR